MPVFKLMINAVSKLPGVCVSGVYQATHKVGPGRVELSPMDAWMKGVPVPDILTACTSVSWAENEVMEHSKRWCFAAFKEVFYTNACYDIVKENIIEDSDVLLVKRLLLGKSNSKGVRSLSERYREAGRFHMAQLVAVTMDYDTSYQEGRGRLSSTKFIHYLTGLRNPGQGNRETFQYYALDYFRYMSTPMSYDRVEDQGNA